VSFKEGWPEYDKECVEYGNGWFEYGAAEEMGHECGSLIVNVCLCTFPSWLSEGI
jgi:hypothetical protein